MSNTTLAFLPTATTEWQDLPACLVLTLTDALRNRILDALNTLKERGFDQIIIRCDFDTPKVCSEELKARLDDEEFVVVNDLEFDETDSMSTDCDEIVVTNGDLWLQCYDHCTSNRIESVLHPITDILGATR